MWYVLFSDGFVTVSPENADNLLAPVYVISSAEQANHNLLKIMGTLPHIPHMTLNTSRKNTRKTYSVKLEPTPDLSISWHHENKPLYLSTYEIYSIKYK